jgi:anti-anti-sigma regulatory factor
MDDKQDLLNLLQKDPQDFLSLQKLLQCYFRQGEAKSALLFVLDLFLDYPSQESCFSLYSACCKLYEAEELRLPLKDRDQMLMIPLSFSRGDFILFGGRLGNQVTCFQEILEPFLGTPRPLILDFLNTRFMDSTCLGYFAHFLETRQKQGFKTYAVDFNERIQICFKYLGLSPLLEGLSPEQLFLSLPAALLHLRHHGEAQKNLTPENTLCFSTSVYKLVPIFPKSSFFEKCWQKLRQAPADPLMYKINEFKF